MSRSSRWLFSFRIPAAFAVLLLTACETTEREASLTELRASRQELRLQFTSLNSQFRPAEMQALDSPSVQVAQAEFRSALEAKMVELDPQAASWFSEAADLGQLIQSAPTDTTLTVEQKRRLAEDLQRLERTIGPVQTQAMQDSAVAERFRTLQDTLMATVMRINPDMRPILASMRELETRILELDQKIARRSGSAPGSKVPDQ
jgi:chromosome segregation ATPase